MKEIINNIHFDLNYYINQKQMNKQGEMVIRNVRPEIMEIFDVTGFSDILTIE